MSSTRIVVLMAFCTVVLAICWFVISMMTGPGRAIAAAVIMTGLTGALIWPAATDRRAIARGIIAMGATAFAAPLAAIQAFQAEFLYAALSDQELSGRFANFDQVFVTGWTLTAIGLVIGLVLMIAGGIMHRRTSRDL